MSDVCSVCVICGMHSLCVCVVYTCYFGSVCGIYVCNAHVIMYNTCTHILPVVYGVVYICMQCVCCVLCMYCVHIWYVV